MTALVPAGPRPADAETPPEGGVSKVVAAKRDPAQSVSEVLAIVPSAPTTVDEWTELIQSHMAKTVESIIDTGSALIDCKAALEHGHFREALEGADISPRVAQMFMAIANHPVLANASRYSQLPAAYNTLYQLARMEPLEIQQALEDKVITSALTINDARMIATQAKHARDRAELIGPYAPVSVIREPGPAETEGGATPFVVVEVPAAIGDPFFCTQCEQFIANGDAIAENRYECGECGTEFTREESSDGDSNRCPDCHKFAGAADDPLVGCPHCDNEIEHTSDRVRALVSALVDRIHENVPLGPGEGDSGGWRWRPDGPLFAKMVAALDDPERDHLADKLLAASDRVRDVAEALAGGA